MTRNAPIGAHHPWIGPMISGVALLGAGLAVGALVNARRNLSLLPQPAAAAPIDETVSVLIPARNEQSTITHALAGVSGQRGLARLEVLVCDDESTDGTASLITIAARRDRRIRLVHGAPPPPGWLGKPWALAQLRTVATGSVLVLLDSDTRLHPDALARAVSTLRTSGSALVSPYPRVSAQWRRDGLLAALVQPLLTWSWLTLLPLDAMRRSRRGSLTAVGGQFLVCDAAALDAVGGFHAIAGEVLDDLALARTLKGAGGLVLLINGSEIAECHMYGDHAAVVAGYTKSLHRAFGGPVGTAGVISLLGLAYLAPGVLALLRPTALTVAAAATSLAAGTASRVMAARVNRVPPWPDALTHPAGILAFCGLALASLIQHRRGRAVWRGRVIP